MPPGSPGKYFIARLRGGDVAAVGSQPEGAPPMAIWNTYVWVDSADETAAKVRDAGGNVLTEPFDVMDAGRMAVFADPEGAVFCVWQAKEHRGAQDRQRARQPELQRPQHARPGGREGLLRRGVRLADARPGRRLRDVDAARLRRLPRARQPRAAREHGRGGRAGGLRGRRREPHPDPRRPAGHAGALGRDVRGRRRRRDRRRRRRSSAAR